MSKINGLSSVVLATFAAAVLAACPRNDEPETYVYRQRMRTFVENISAYAKAQSEGFLIIPQNGLELLAQDPGEEDLKAITPEADYLAAIDGVGREDLFYGYDADNAPTPQEVTDSFLEYLELAEQNGIEALVTDYCWTHARIDASYANNNQRGFISFAADRRDLDGIPSYPLAPHGENADPVTSLTQAGNFLYLINPGAFGSKTEFLDTIASSRYDLILVDLFYEDSALTPEEIARLKQKPQGGSRLVIAYMSIGEAEDYRFYWQSGWKPGNPDWIESENPNWPGNFVVRYWDPDWQALIFGSPNAYLDRILAAGFDGVYLDIIDAFESFESKK